VLLHGANDQAGTWAGAVRMLAKDYRLVLPDLAGHGESEPKEGPITFPMMLARVHAIIEQEAKGKITIGGNSMGGWLSTLYALDYPDRVERLVLENGSGLLWPVTISLLPKTREEAAAAMKAVNGPADKTPDDVLDALVNRKNPPLARLVTIDIVKYLVDGRVKDLKMPVTIIWGRHDGILPVAYAETLHKEIPRSTLTIIEGAGHIPHRQQPAKFVECLNATY
jgi:pimeloyl-ACP methyl ester carboxylesterase